MSLFNEEIRNRMRENTLVSERNPRIHLENLRFGNALKKYRQAKCVSACRMSIDLDLNRGYIANVEGGYFIPSMTRLEKIASYLDIPVDKLTEYIEGDIRPYISRQKDKPKYVESDLKYVKPDNAYDVVIVNKVKQMIHGKTLAEKKQLLAMINKYLSEQNNPKG